MTIPGRLKRRVRCLSNLCWRRQLSKWSAGEPKWNRWTLLFHISFPPAPPPIQHIPRAHAFHPTPAETRLPCWFFYPECRTPFFLAQGRSAGEQSKKYSTNSAQIWPKGNILSIPISSEDEKKLSRNNKKRTTKGGSSSRKINPPKRGPSIFLFFFSLSPPPPQQSIPSGTHCRKTGEDGIGTANVGARLIADRYGKYICIGKIERGRATKKL